MAISIYFSLLLIFLSQFPSSNAEPFIGVNYGQVADNLPPPSETAKLIQSTSIQKVRLYGADPAIIKALAGTGVGIVIGTANGDLPSLAADPNAASQWISSNVLPFYPASKIILITVGNEVLLSKDPNLVSQLLPAMQNVQKALEAASLGGKIKVSTVHAMSVLGSSEPPSSGSFASGYQAGLKGILQFLSDTGSPFAINPYPFFAYQSDPRPETLAFCLFQPNAGRPDSNTGITYMNMFDAQGISMRDDVLLVVKSRTDLSDVDAVHSALKSMGFEKVEIVVAETGWASRGDPNEVGPSVDNAKAYNGNLIAHLRSMVGTPLMPGKSVDTYIFALYDENLKTGPSSERAFGLFKTDHSMAYDVGLAKSSGSSSNSSSQTPSGKASTGWCVSKKDATDEQLQSSIDWACGQGIDCGAIQPGGACFEPNNVASHAAFAMNMYYQKSPKRPTDCDFSQTATITSQNPSYNSCVYPGGGGGDGSTGVMNKYVNSNKIESKKNGAVESKKPKSEALMSVSELKERHAVATETVNSLRDKLRQRRLQLLDTDVAKYSAAQGRSPVKFGATDLVCCRTLLGHTGKVYSLDWTPERNRIVSASQDGRLIVWNALTSQKTHAIKLPCAWVMTCAFSPNGQTVACGGLDSVCSIFSLSSTADKDGTVPVSRTLSGHRGYVSCCQYVPNEDAHLITSSGDQTCVLWDVTTGLKTSVFGGEFQSGHTGDVLRYGISLLESVCLINSCPYVTYCLSSVSISGSNPNWFISGSCDTSACLWDTRAASRAVRTFHGHEGDVNTVKFFPDGYRFGTGSDDGTCRLYDLRTGHQLQVYHQAHGDGENLPVTSIAFSASGRLLFAGYANNNTCYVWDTLLGEVVLDLGELQDSHKNRISCLGMSADGSALCTGSWDSNLKITESLKRCGISETTTYILAARFNASPFEMEEVAKLINGKEIDLEELKTQANEAHILKHYKITSQELVISSLGDAIVCRIAARDAL
ncbi:hypothetical protein Bca101_079901 [Brassica carinata]